MRRSSLLVATGALAVLIIIAVIVLVGLSLRTRSHDLGPGVSVSPPSAVSPTAPRTAPAGVPAEPTRLPETADE
ncbi:hypothetical protein H8R18_07180 [Nanchangia anserum]|uniref:Uncharacterized protein n=1 Tax=Nanchangia anserum TaxID=2692125 RepID=A0A8I0G7J6_9ACTO|nr:hypothetical protein [Nanchangia anserum]MBD3689310.1 hypothetical protein [Nanchangia anserum]QOX81525.1 hypothetical protein H8R18_07180 [Nanchangia anserum]